MSINLKTLITKLNDTTRLATERAASLCISRGHYEVDIEHLLLALLEQDKSDLHLILRCNDIDPRQLAADVQAETEQFQSGNSRTPVFSPNLAKLFEHAWLIASLDNASANIRSGQLLLALLSAPDLQQLAWRSSKLFSRIGVDVLKHDLNSVTLGSQPTPPWKCKRCPMQSLLLNQQLVKHLCSINTPLISLSVPAMASLILSLDVIWKFVKPLTFYYAVGKTTPYSQASLV